MLSFYFLMCLFGDVCANQQRDIVNLDVVGESHLLKKDTVTMPGHNVFKSWCGYTLPTYYLPLTSVPCPSRVALVCLVGYRREGGRETNALFLS